MLKVRQPDTIAAAVNLIAATVGHDECAKAIGKTTGLIYGFADPDKDARPSVEQAIKLDALYIAATNEPGPIMQVYMRQLTEKVGELRHTPVDPRQRLAQIGAEFGDVCRMIPEIMADGKVSPRERAASHKAIDEIVTAAKKLKRDIDAMAGRR